MSAAQVPVTTEFQTPRMEGSSHYVAEYSLTAVMS